MNSNWIDSTSHKANFVRYNFFYEFWEFSCVQKSGPSFLNNAFTCIEPTSQHYPWKNLLEKIFWEILARNSSGIAPGMPLGLLRAFLMRILLEVLLGLLRFPMAITLEFLAINSWEIPATILCRNISMSFWKYSKRNF